MSYFHTIGQKRAAARSIKSKQEAIQFFWRQIKQIWEKLTPCSQATLGKTNTKSADFQLILYLFFRKYCFRRISADFTFVFPEI